MGITVPDLALDSIGVTLPQAYIAVAKNTVVLYPQDGTGVFLVSSSFSVWSSHQARASGKGPVQTVSVSVLWDSLAVGTLDHMYLAIYEEVKARYPAFEDAQAGMDPLAVAHGVMGLTGGDEGGYDVEAPPP